MPDLLAARSQNTALPFAAGAVSGTVRRFDGGLVLFASLIYLLRVFKREPTRP
jgi:hypothetical protein